MPLLTHFLLPAWYSKMRWNSSTSCNDSGGTNTLSSRSSCSFGPTGPQRRTWRQAIWSLSGDLPPFPWNLFSKVHPALSFVSTKNTGLQIQFWKLLVWRYGLKSSYQGAGLEGMDTKYPEMRSWQKTLVKHPRVLHRHSCVCWIPGTLLGAECLFPTPTPTPLVSMSRSDCRWYWKGFSGRKWGHKGGFLIQSDWWP